LVENLSRFQKKGSKAAVVAGFANGKQVVRPLGLGTIRVKLVFSDHPLLVSELKLYPQVVHILVVNTFFFKGLNEAENFTIILSVPASQISPKNVILASSIAAPVVLFHTWIAGTRSTINSALTTPLAF